MAAMIPEPMRLQFPTDRLILEHLLEGRNLAANIAAEIDRSRNYINQRMAHLNDYGLVEKVGPVDGTGLYQITARGGAVIALSDQYSEDEEFEDLVASRAEHIDILPPRLVDAA